MAPSPQRSEGRVPDVCLNTVSVQPRPLGRLPQTAGGRGSQAQTRKRLGPKDRRLTAPPLSGHCTFSLKTQRVFPSPLFPDGVPIMSRTHFHVLASIQDPFQQANRRL